jgi:hypothetical protein
VSETNVLSTSDRGTHSQTVIVLTGSQSLGSYKLTIESRPPEATYLAKLASTQSMERALEQLLTIPLDPRPMLDTLQHGQQGILFQSRKGIHTA